MNTCSAPSVRLQSVSLNQISFVPQSSFKFSLSKVLLSLTALLAATYVSALGTGYRLNDLLVYLPMTLYLRDPSLYPGSALVHHLLSMPYPLYHAYAVAFSEYGLFLVFLAARLALVLSLYMLGKQLVHDRTAVWLGLA